MHSVGQDDDVVLPPLMPLRHLAALESHSGRPGRAYPGHESVCAP